MLEYILHLFSMLKVNVIMQQVVLVSFYYIYYNTSCFGFNITAALLFTAVVV